MMRLLAIAVVVICTVVAVWVLTQSNIAQHHNIGKSHDAPSDVIPIALQSLVDCMYRELATTPGVRKPEQGFVTSSGWTHPFLEYTATIHPYVGDNGETIRVYPTRFEAQRSGRNHDEYWFLASFAGPTPPGFDEDQMQLIMRSWKERCHVTAEVEVN